MARDHIVPKMLLRRFADARGYLKATPRNGEARLTMTVNRACTEVGFYDLDIDPAYQHLAPRNQVEQSLADFEGRASQLFDRFANDVLTLTDQDRFDLMLFVAFQSVRGWSFRDELSQVSTLIAKEELEPKLTDKRLRADLRKRGESYDDNAVAAWREDLLASPWNLIPPDSVAVQAMVNLALNVIHPQLYFRRRVRLLRFAEPTLLVSDEPVAIWVRRDHDHNASPVGLATADAIYVPIDRRHALQLLLSGDEVVVESNPKKAQVINLAIATGSHRWIFQHPDDAPFDVTGLSDRPSWSVETLGVTTEPDKIRVQKRLVRQPSR